LNSKTPPISGGVLHLYAQRYTATQETIESYREVGNIHRMFHENFGVTHGVDVEKKSEEEYVEQLHAALHAESVQTVGDNGELRTRADIFLPVTVDEAGDLIQSAAVDGYTLVFTEDTDRGGCLFTYFKVDPPLQKAA
jgi:hypothetical protein